MKVPFKANQVASFACGGVQGYVTLTPAVVNCMISELELRAPLDGLLGL